MALDLWLGVLAKRKNVNKVIGELKAAMGEQKKNDCT